MIVSSIFGSQTSSQPKQQPQQQSTTETTTTERSDTQASTAPPAAEQQTRVTEPSATSSSSTSRTTAETAPVGDRAGPDAPLRSDSGRAPGISAEDLEAMARAQAEQARQSAQLAAVIESIASVGKSFEIDAADPDTGDTETTPAKYADAEAAFRDVDPSKVSMTA